MTTSQAYLNHIFQYVEGALYYKVRPAHHFSTIAEENRWNSQYAGSLAGSVEVDSSGKSYLRVSVDNRKTYAHNVVWKMLRGDIPAGLEVDHIDGNGLINLISNLRLTDRTGNNRNRRLFSSNKTGISGVCFCKRRRRFRCSIKNNQGTTDFIRFKDLFSAACWRKSKELEYEYHENHGKDRPL